MDATEDILLGRIAVKNGMCTKEQIEEALDYQDGDGSPLGEVLVEETGADRAAEFASTEHLFSGRGLVRLYQALSGDAGRGAEEIVADAAQGGDGVAGRCVDLMARLLSLFARQLVFQYMPLGGIHFAGSVARGIFETRARAVLAEGFEDTGPFGHLIAQVPLRLITDDAAALTGLARLGRSMLDQRPTA